MNEPDGVSNVLEDSIEYFLNHPNRSQISFRANRCSAKMQSENCEQTG